MRTKKAGFALVGLGLILAGCGNGDDSGGGPTPGNTTGSPTGTVASCVTGQWRSTAVDTRVGGDAAGARLTGGAGIAVTIDQNGATRIDFAGMEPMNFTAQVAGADVRGTFVYAGQATGRITTGAREATGTPTPGGTASPTAPASPTATAGATDTASPTVGATGTAGTARPGATDGATATATATPTGDQSGTWRPEGDIDWSDTRLTLDLTQPVQARPFDNVPIGQYVGSGAERSGNAVDIDPFFDNGRYTCQGDRLVLTPDEDGDVPWTLTRA